MAVSISGGTCGGSTPSGSGRLWPPWVMTNLVRRAAGEILGRENVLELEAPSLGTDDFGYFSDAAPGCYYYVGVGNEGKGFTLPNHNPRFAADPEALPLAAAVHVQCVLDYLAEQL